MVGARCGVDVCCGSEQYLTVSSTISAVPFLPLGPIQECRYRLYCLGFTEYNIPEELMEENRRRQQRQQHQHSRPVLPMLVEDDDSSDDDDDNDEAM